MPTPSDKTNATATPAQPFYVPPPPTPLPYPPPPVEPVFGEPVSGADFAAFRHNAFIGAIAEQSRWTASTKNKMPLDMYAIEWLDGRVMGAMNHSKQCLYPLDRVRRLIPEASNFAYYLSAQDTPYVILDIEPSCPESLRRSLLDTDFLYAETSMSGKGLHLAYKMPESVLKAYPNIINKTVLRHPKKYYEILINHYVTFTAKQIGAKPAPSGFERLFLGMCAKQKRQIEIDPSVDISISMQHPVIPFEEKILVSLESGKFRKTLSDYGNDNSEYEYHAIMHYYNNIKPTMLALAILDPRIMDHRYTIEELSWLLYDAVARDIPHRPKHDTKRQGMPYLLWRCMKIMIRRINDGLSLVADVGNGANDEYETEE